MPAPVLVRVCTSAENAHPIFTTICEVGKDGVSKISGVRFESKNRITPLEIIDFCVKRGWTIFEWFLNLGEERAKAG